MLIRLSSSLAHIPQSLANADVLIMLYAIDDAQSLNQSCIETLLPIARTHVPELPIVLVGTKEELLHDISPGAEDAIRAALQLVLQAEKVHTSFLSSLCLIAYIWQLVGQHNIVAHSLCSAVCGIGTLHRDPAANCLHEV